MSRRTPTRRSASVLAVGAFSLLLSTTAVAEQAPPPPPPGKPVPCAPPPPPPPMDPFESGSLLVKFSIGPGYLWGSGDPNTGMQSAAGGFGVTMGAFIVKGLALHGDFNWVNGFDPDYWVEGTVDHETNLVFQTSSFRVGATYYSEPMRVWGSLGVGVGAALATTFYYLDNNDISASTSEYTKVGPTFALQVGKDWPVSRYWSLGVAVDYQYLHVSPADDARISLDDAQQLGLRFVGTFAGH